MIPSCSVMDEIVSVAVYGCASRWLYICVRWRLDSALSLSISTTPWRSSFGLAALALTPGLVAQFVVDNGSSRVRDSQLPRQVES